MTTPDDRAHDEAHHQSDDQARDRAVRPGSLVLVTGAILAPGQRTVSAALRVMGGGGQSSIGVADGMPPQGWRIGRVSAATTRC